mmetsp:Transcript_20540/g.33349  ORF Transcript_20540/g.33349 Transcript_20540/m.33349 type:complete len:228 (+) Transcript_20540:111-794(+)
MIALAAASPKAIAAPVSAAQLEDDSPKSGKKRKLTPSSAKTCPRAFPVPVNTMNEIQLTFQNMGAPADAQCRVWINGNTFHIALPLSMSGLKFSVHRTAQSQCPENTQNPETLKTTNCSTSSAKRELKKNRHTCSCCTKWFKTKYRLRRHQRSHTGTRPFACDLCLASFRQKPHLKGHMKAMHFNHMNSLITDPSSSSNYGMHGEKSAKPTDSELGVDAWNWMKCLQ